MGDIEEANRDLVVYYRSRIAELEAENKRMIDMAGEALGFSPYQRDHDTVEVSANHAKRLAEELAECKAEIHRARTDSRYWDEFNTISAHDATRNENAALRARCERLEKALKNLVEKLFKVHDDPEYYAVWSLYASHIPGGYKGLTYTKELDEAKQALEVPK